MAHRHYQVSETGAGLSRNCVPGVAQVMQMQIWNADLLADLGPGNRLVEVARCSGSQCSFGNTSPDSPSPEN
jgi:hypothetical protein